MTPRTLRVLTAVLLGLSAGAFAAGTAAERASHHAREAGATPAPSVATPTPAPSVTAASAVPASSARPRISTNPTRDPRLSAPEGSKQREAGERAARLAKASAQPRATSRATAAVAPSPTTPSTPPPDALAPEGSAAREAAEGRRTSGNTEAGERLFGINTESRGLVGLAVVTSLVLLVLLVMIPAGRWAGAVAAATFAFALAATALDVREAVHQYDLAQTGLGAAALGVALLHLLTALGALALLRPVRRA